MTRRVLVAGLVVAGLVLAGCGSSDAKVTETRDGRITVEGDGDRQTATIQGDGSSVTYGTGSVPKGFPDAVPLPEGSKPATTAAATRGDAQFFTLTYEPTTSAAKALSAYGDQLAAAGFDVTPGARRSIEGTDGTWRVRAVAGTGAAPTLTVSVTDS